MGGNNNRERIDYKYYEYQSDKDCRSLKEKNRNFLAVKKGLIIDDNTVYEIDEECINCLKDKMKGNTKE